MCKAGTQAIIGQLIYLSGRRHLSGKAAFHGDVSIDPKWQAAERLVSRWLKDGIHSTILYYGDLDRKGEQIPDSAWKDVQYFAACIFTERGLLDEEFEDWKSQAKFIRIGLNREHVTTYNIPENPERPGTYQWEGLSDEGARELIGLIDNYLNLPALERVENEAERAVKHIRQALEDLESSRDQEAT